VKVVMHLHITCKKNWSYPSERKLGSQWDCSANNFPFETAVFRDVTPYSLCKQVLILRVNLLRHLQCPTGPEYEVRNIISTLKTEAVSFYLPTRLHEVAYKIATAFIFTSNCTTPSVCALCTLTPGGEEP
jgi:hypothetical protein